MKAFAVALRALVATYNELFLLVGLSLLWWVTGGIFLGLAAALAVVLLSSGGPWWLAPLVSIPAGPASAALAVVARRCVRSQSVDRSFYFDGFRAHWRRALVVSMVSAVTLCLLLLNVLFYLSQSQTLLRALAFLFAYIVFVSLAIQLYIYPVMVSLTEPRILVTLKTATLAAFANPIFSLILVLVTAAITALSIVVPVLLVLVWPAILALLGAEALKLILERFGVASEDAAGT